MNMAQIVNHGLHEGQMLKEVRLHNGALSLSLLNLGAVTRDLRLLQDGADLPLVLGFSDPAAYFDNPGYLGVIAGRVAGRIKNAQFALGETHYRLDVNEGNDQLHGGPRGLARVLWDVEPISDTEARFRYDSPAGENGFPGDVAFCVTVRLDGLAVEYDMTARVSAPTPISLAQHNYYNLTGGRSPIWDHRLQVDASRYLLPDDTNVPNGEIAELDGTRYDMRFGRSLGALDPTHLGSNVNLVFDPDRDRGLPVATLTAPTGLQMVVTSDQVGAQIYTATSLDPHQGGLPGQALGPAMGLCFEPQGFPNAVNQRDFPSVIATPESPYVQKLRLDFGWI
ncbi:aldose epimerase family protein [Tritonibacter horizontis]|uniref:Aldose 1-epimerase n=1 Tax=Tritonibacter horizontis TaxID=1768241 RepID=A0A132C311_9RHOB|nr:aldose epimerase family protein [Tritonibacter horizontis]KUP94916.1 aldose 1-epimerase precursor [Tritonibacter horizontis]